jgi:hypothetical protein
MMKILASLRSDSWTTSAGSGGHLPSDYPDNFTGLRRSVFRVVSIPHYEPASEALPVTNTDRYVQWKADPPN